MGVAILKLMKVYTQYVNKIFNELDFLNIFTYTEIVFKDEVTYKPEIKSDYIEGYPVRSLGIDLDGQEVKLIGEFQFPKIVNAKIVLANGLRVKTKIKEYKIPNHDLSPLFKLYASICDYIFGELEEFSFDGSFITMRL